MTTMDYGPRKRQTLTKVLSRGERSLLVVSSGKKQTWAHFSTHVHESKFFLQENKGIHFMPFMGEKLSYITCIEPFKLRFLHKVKDLHFSSSHLYIADESGLFLACDT